MKTFIYIAESNYGEISVIVNADTKEEAERIALTSEYGWEDGTTVEVDTTTPGIVLETPSIGEE